MRTCGSARSGQATGLHADRRSRGQPRTDGDGPLDDPPRPNPCGGSTTSCCPPPRFRGSQFPWLQTWLRSRPSGAIRWAPSETRGLGHAGIRMAVNIHQQTWKACWGQPLAGSNPASSAPSDQVIRLTCSVAAHPRGRVLVSVLVHNPALKRALIRAYVVSSATTAVPAVPLSGIEGELMRAAHAGVGALE